MLINVAGKPAITSSMALRNTCFQRIFFHLPLSHVPSPRIAYALHQGMSFCQHGQSRKAANHCRQHRQRDMPQIIGDFLIPRQRIKVSGNQAAQREQIEIAAAREEDNQQDGKQKAGMA